MAAGRRGGVGAAPAAGAASRARERDGGSAPPRWPGPCSRRALAASRRAVPAPGGGGWGRVPDAVGQGAGGSASLGLRRLRGPQLQVSALRGSTPRVALQPWTEKFGHLAQLRYSGGTFRVRGARGSAEAGKGCSEGSKAGRRPPPPGPAGSATSAEGCAAPARGGSSGAVPPRPLPLWPRAGVG